MKFIFWKLCSRNSKIFPNQIIQKSHYEYLNLKVKLHRDHITCGRLITTNEFFGRIKEKQLEDVLWMC